jgi:IS30 family transposase
MPGRRLGLEEREEIRVGLVRGESLRQIARRIERPVSTVAREVKRNGGPTRYVATCAQGRAERCARRPKIPRLCADRDVAARVTKALENRESPMTIARREGVSHETIYQAIDQSNRGLDREIVPSRVEVGRRSGQLMLQRQRTAGVEQSSGGTLGERRGAWGDRDGR